MIIYHRFDSFFIYRHFYRLCRNWDHFDSVIEHDEDLTCINTISIIFFYSLFFSSEYLSIFWFFIRYTFFQIFLINLLFRIFLYDLTTFFFPFAFFINFKWGDSTILITLSICINLFIFLIVIIEIFT